MTSAARELIEAINRGRAYEDRGGVSLLFCREHWNELQAAKKHALAAVEAHPEPDRCTCQLMGPCVCGHEKRLSDALIKAVLGGKQSQPEPDVEALIDVFMDRTGFARKSFMRDVIRNGIRAVLAALKPVCRCGRDTGVRTESGWHCAECGLPIPAEPECCVWTGGDGQWVTACGRKSISFSSPLNGVPCVCGKPIRLAGEERP